MLDPSQNVYFSGIALMFGGIRILIQTFRIRHTGIPTSGKIKSMIRILVNDMDSHPLMSPVPAVAAVPGAEVAALPGVVVLLGVVLLLEVAISCNQSYR